MRACTPDRQSAVVACSAGLWLTPVGLRTNSMAVGTCADSTPASCPAPVGSVGTGAPSRDSTATRRSRRPAPNSTSGDTDSRVTVTSTPCGTAARSAAAVRSARTRSRAVSSGARASSQAWTADGTAFVPFGSTRTRPIVATASARSAASRAAMTVCANGSMGSRRSRSRVVPAWLASPWKEHRQRPCGQIAVATPTGAGPSASHRPCSTCSSTNAPMRASRSSSRPSPSGSRPAARIASASVTPSAPVSARARSASSAPVSSRDPAHATPNLAPSSSAKFTTATGRDGRTPRSRSSRTASSALTTPSGPSYAPPSGTESRWLPVTSASAPGVPHHAHWLPLRSVSTSSPAARASAANHARHSRSAASYANRRYPPVSGSRPIGASASHMRPNACSGLMRGLSWGRGRRWPRRRARPRGSRRRRAG